MSHLVEVTGGMEHPSLSPDTICQLLNKALASEVMCMLRYRRHQFAVKGLESITAANEFKEHAEDETRHMLMIAERINQLGGDPDFSPLAAHQNKTTKYGTAGTLLEMLTENLVYERAAVELYRSQIATCASDPTTRRLLEEILKDEEEHVTDLADMLPRDESF